MTNLPFALKFPAVLRTISWKTSGRCFRHGHRQFGMGNRARPVLFLFTGLGARLRCAYLVVAALIALPFDFYAGYVRAHAAGRSDQTLANWLKGEAVPLVVRLVVASLLIWFPYRLIARSPRRSDFSELSDPASLPLIVFLLTFFWLAFPPFFNLLSRHIELEADRFGRVDSSEPRRGDDIRQGCSNQSRPRLGHFLLSL